MWTYWFAPFLKSSYLYYPQDNSFYFGIGANIGFVAIGPLVTIGYELFSKSDKLFMFIELDASYPCVGGDFLGSIVLGIGF